MKNRNIVITEVILCSVGLMVFSFFIHYSFPLKLLSFAGLAASGLIIGKNLATTDDLARITGNRPSLACLGILLPAGLIPGFGLVLLYRWYLGISLVPSGMHGFIFIAAIIGITEEMIFRGYVQGNIRDISATLSIFGGSLAHTGYKCCLFMSPPVAGSIDIGFLALWTMIAGMVFGTINHFTKSIIPSLSAHALFDILVYAEFVNAPWWVW